MASDNLFTAGSVSYTHLYEINSDESVIYQYDTNVLNTVSGNLDYLERVKQGMRECVSTTFCEMCIRDSSNSRRVELSKFKIDETRELMAEHGIMPENIIIHAPYLSNLANTFKPETFMGGVECLVREIERTQAIGAKILVLHPGSHVNAGTEAGIKKICEGLDQAMENIGDTMIRCV